MIISANFNVLFSIVVAADFLLWFVVMIDAFSFEVVFGFLRYIDGTQN